MKDAAVWALGMAVIACGVAACASTNIDRAAQDDKTCQSYGAKPGTEAYVQCRTTQQVRRDQGQNRDCTEISIPFFRREVCN